MARLRHPMDGSPWERDQSHQSIAPNLLEEAYEAVDAITRNDIKELKGELGDVLLQVVFHSQMAKEAGHFTFNEVVTTLNNKIKSRLPAFFSGKKEDVTAQLNEWERIKAAERASKGYESIFDGVAINLPALARANKLQDRAERVGFTWREESSFVDKIDEEVAEVKEALAEGDKAHLEEEIGDLLFITSRLAHLKGIDAETALRKANAKFERRLRHTETSLKKKNIALKDASLDELVRLWQEAKQIEKSGIKTA